MWSPTSNCMHMMSRQVSPAYEDWICFIAGGAAGDIDIDNDGFMPDTRILIDLSHALSQRLGRQMSMFSTYKVDYISINLVNKDDTGVDNDSGAEFAGRVLWHTPSKHRIEALQLMRQLEKVSESTVLDADSWLISTEKDYSGVRFNWDDDDQVLHATSEAFTTLSGSQWDMSELFSIYDIMEGAPQQQNALWSGRTGYPNSLAWNCYYRNNAWDTDGVDSPIYQPESSIFQANNLKLEVLGGLMVIDVTNSSTDDTAHTIDDDYNVVVTIGVSGWSDF